MENEWTKELIEAYGAFPIWTVRWQEYYVQHERLCQYYAAAERIAREKHGCISLTVRDYSIPSAGAKGISWLL
jgi:hypothetical protein